jgi:magnesium chelatase family protein
MQRRNPDGLSNGSLGTPAFRRRVQIDDAALRLWQHAIPTRGLSGRSADRVLRVAQTIADLDGDSTIGERAIGEALSYRSFDQMG